MNRWLAIVSVTALLLSGISIGALGFLLYHHHMSAGHGFDPQMPMMPPPEAMLDHLDTRLGLSMLQRKQIAAILDESHRRSEEIRREVRSRLEKQIEETHEKIAALLTPEQRATFELLQKEQRSHAERFFLGEHAHMDGHAPPPPPPPPEP
jgi:Spy/CpxP family protein refolding chaperone